MVSKRVDDYKNALNDVGEIIRACYSDEISTDKALSKLYDYLWLEMGGYTWINHVAEIISYKKDK